MCICRLYTRPGRYSTHSPLPSLPNSSIRANRLPSPSLNFSSWDGPEVHANAVRPHGQDSASHNGLRMTTPTPHIPSAPPNFFLGRRGAYTNAAVVAPAEQEVHFHEQRRDSYQGPVITVAIPQSPLGLDNFFGGHQGAHTNAPTRPAEEAVSPRGEPIASYNGPRMPMPAPYIPPAPQNFSLGRRGADANVAVAEVEKEDHPHAQRRDTY